MEEEQDEDTGDFDVTEQRRRAAAEDEDNEDEFDDDGPRVVTDVKLAKTIGAPTSFPVSEYVC